MTMTKFAHEFFAAERAAFAGREFAEFMSRLRAQVITEYLRIYGSCAQTQELFFYMLRSASGSSQPTFYRLTPVRIWDGVLKIWVISSVGRTLALQAGCHGFESHMYPRKMGCQSQFGRAPALHAGGQGFEPLTVHYIMPFNPNLVIGPG